MKILLTVLIAFLVFSPGFSQGKYEVIDRAAISTKANNLETLHLNLTKNLLTDEEKVRSFFMWITENIRYDVQSWVGRSSDWEKQEPENVLKYGRAVCHGYSALLQELCLRSGIKSHLVSGYTKRNNIFNSEGHTWNMVFINDMWRAIDATWGAGGVAGDRKFIKQRDEKYFLSNPHEFLSDHYPFDPMWQLQYSPVKLTEYKKPSWKTGTISPQGNFNFKDTITAWEQLDSLNRQLNSAHRMVNMNPGDINSKMELSRAQLNMADSELHKGNTLLSELYHVNGKNQKILSGGSIAESKAKLEVVLRHYEKADSVYKTVNIYNQADRSGLENARKVLRHNMEVIKQERERLSTGR